MARPCKLTEESQRRIVQGVLAGLNKEEAAICAGVSYDSLRRWEKRGEEESSGPFHEFCVALKRARAQLHADCLASIHRARRGGEVIEETREEIKNGKVIKRTTTRKVLPPQWQAAAWILERDCPENWTRPYPRDVRRVRDEEYTIALPRQMYDGEDPEMKELAELSDQDLVALIRASKEAEKKAEEEQEDEGPDET